MKSNNPMPGVDRNRSGGNTSKSEKINSSQKQQNQLGSSLNNEKSQKNKKGNPVYIKDMPEIKPATSSVM